MNSPNVRRQWQINHKSSRNSTIVSIWMGQQHIFSHQRQVIKLILHGITDNNGTMIIMCGTMQQHFTWSPSRNGLAGWSANVFFIGFLILVGFLFRLMFCNQPSQICIICCFRSGCWNRSFFFLFYYIICSSPSSFSFCFSFFSWDSSFFLWFL